MQGGYKVQPAVLVDVSIKRKKEFDGTVKRTQGWRYAKRIAGATAEVTRQLTQDAKCSIIGKAIDQNDDKDIELITMSSKKLTDNKKLTPEATANIITKGNFTREQQRLVVRVGNNMGRQLFASEAKTLKAKQNMLKGIDRQYYEVKTVFLQKKTQGENKKLVGPAALIYLKNYRGMIEHIIEEEIDKNYRFKLLDDGKKELEIGITADAGGGSKKVSFSLMNRTDGKLIQHILMIYEAGDTLENNIRCYAFIKEQVANLNGAELTVNGETYKVKQKGKFVLIK